MDNKERLMNQYGNNIHIGEKTINELVNFLTEKGTVVEMAQSEILPYILGNMIYNIKCVEKDEGLCPTEEEPDPIEYVKNPVKFIQKSEFDFLAYKFLKCEENLTFYQNYSPFEGGFIYVIFETNTKTIYCNCTKLQIELVIEKCISKYDYDNTTNKFLNYLVSMEFLDNGWY